MSKSLFIRCSEETHTLAKALAKKENIESNKQNALAVNDESLTGLTDQEVAAQYDANIAKAQAEKGNFMLQVLMNPAATKTVAESMAISAGIKQAEPIAAEKLRRLAITIFYTQMGEDYPVEIKSASWIKQQLEFVPRTLSEIRQASKRQGMGITKEQDAPYSIREEVDDLSRYDKFLN